MTLFAVMQAGLFPLLHLGRPWFFYWLIPYPATMHVWPQLQERAPLGRRRGLHLLHRLAALLVPRAHPRSGRRCATARRTRGSGSSTACSRSAGAARPSHWRHYRIAYGLLAGLATPLVLSVHSVVSADFAIAQLARLALDDLPALLRRGRDLLGLRDGADADDPDPRASSGSATSSPTRHLDNVGKMLLVTGLDRRLLVLQRVLPGLVRRRAVRDVHHVPRRCRRGRTAGRSG